MFNNLAGRYDLFNHLTSMGLATHWRKKTLKSLEPGMRVLDLGCGTGDLALDAIKKIGPSGEVIGLDFSENMLAFAQKRYKKLEGNNHYPDIHNLLDSNHHMFLVYCLDLYNGYLHIYFLL